MEFVDAAPASSSDPSGPHARAGLKGLARSRSLCWLLALLVFVGVFAAFSYRLGLQPVFEHDDYEYTYPSFSLAAHGHYGSPLLGPGFNIERRTYNLTIHYYATVHAALIRVFGTGPGSIPLANLFHFALLAALGVLVLLRRGAWLGACLYAAALVADPRMIDAARHGRPEMTAGFCLFAAVLALWARIGEGRSSPALVFAASAALAAGMLSHTSVVFFTLALLLATAWPLLRSLRRADVVAGLVPVLFLVSLAAYFVLTDSLENIRGQMAPGAGDIVFAHLLARARAGEWVELGKISTEFLRAHGSWWTLAGLLASLGAPVLTEHPFARAARFLGALFALFFVVNFLFLKHFVVSYGCIYLATLLLAFAFAAETVVVWAAARFSRARLVMALRVAAALLAAAAVAHSVREFHSRLADTPRAPYARVQSALVAAFKEAGAKRGDRVFVPSPFGFHVTHEFDVVAHPAPKYFRGRWSPEFRDGLHAIWGDAARSQDALSLCHAMGLAYVRPQWVLAWNGDYSVMRPWWDFLKRFRGLPGIELKEAWRAELPGPYGGGVRVYRLSLTDEVLALDRSVNSAQSPCP
jgi:hypothetical protein